MNGLRVGSRVGLRGLFTVLAALWLVRVVATTSAVTPAEISTVASASAAHPHAMGAQGTQSAPRASQPSDGCLSCHKNARDPHPVQQSLSCVDCHGGDGTA